MPWQPRPCCNFRRCETDLVKLAIAIKTDLLLHLVDDQNPGCELVYRLFLLTMPGRHGMRSGQSEEVLFSGLPPFR